MIINKGYKNIKLSYIKEIKKISESTNIIKEIRTYSKEKSICNI